MKIAQVAPLYERIIPAAYGDIEFIISLLTDELVYRGHQVTLFASGDSKTSARLEPSCLSALRDSAVTEAELLFYQMQQSNKIFAHADEFDLIHSHIGTIFPYANLVQTPILHTAYSLDSFDTVTLWLAPQQQNFVSTFNSQTRDKNFHLSYLAMIDHGLDIDIYPFHCEPEDPPYLAFADLISPETGVHLAIEIALQSGWNLKIAGKVDPVDLDFFESQVKPLIDGRQIEFWGEVNHWQKCPLLGCAAATLSPITKPESFNLTVIESMAVGTPVIASQRDGKAAACGKARFGWEYSYPKRAIDFTDIKRLAKVRSRLGSAEEIIEDGKTGFLCNTTEEYLAAVNRLGEIDRQACRDRVIANFTVKRMVDDYEAVYDRLLSKNSFSNCDRKSVPNKILNKN